MADASFKHNYHDGQLAGFTLGPRRELTLEINLDPVWNAPSHSPVSIRLGAIENFTEVASFMNALPKPTRPDVYIAEVDRLKYAGRQKWVTLHLSDYGRVVIQSRHVSELP